MVLLGTLYPLIGDALGVGRISVGPPYFGFMFVLLMLPVVLPDSVRSDFSAGPRPTGARAGARCVRR